MKILACDPASLFGWSISTEIYGTWDLKTLRDESMGMKLIRLKSKLKEFTDIDLLVYERAAGQHKASIIHEAKMIGVMENWCEENGVDYRAYSAKEIKKDATGNGNCSKEAMVKAAKEKYGYPGNDDNEADAIHLWNLANNEYNK
jgi:Holliday junction resolvasome RuvABC endonuclease subunit